MFAGLIETAPVEDARPAPVAETPASAEDTFGEQTQPLTRRASRDSSGRGTGARSVPRPATDAKRQLVLDTYRQLDWLSHYDLLGVSRKATQEEIDAAYETRARLFDPSPKAHPDLVDLWRQLTVLSRWIKVAHGVLSDPENRANYDKKIAEAIPPLPPPSNKS
ncbi:MAG TPA: J domain-containing protein [Thermoanaerobaculia bacterium]